MAVVLDIWRLVAMMGKRTRQLGQLRVGLRIVPAHRFLIAKNIVAVVQNLASRKVYHLLNAQFQTIENKT
jgi:hypothetical protein